MIRLAKLVGTAMTEGGGLGDLLRRVVAPRLHRVPGLQQHILDGQTPPLRRSDLVVRPRLRRTLAGRLCPNPTLDQPPLRRGGRRPPRARHDGDAYRATAGPHRAVRRRPRPGTGGHRVAAWLTHGRARAAIVRPDGAVLRAGRDLTALCATLPRPDAPPRIAGSGRRAGGTDRSRARPTSRLRRPARVRSV